MIELRVCSAAQQDYAEALKWYAVQSPLAADRFDAEVDAAMRSISDHPERYPLCDDRHRFYLLQRFPFRIIYRRAQDWIDIIAIAHTSREPTMWHSR